jgi:LacI family transcriptional regulator
MALKQRMEKRRATLKSVAEAVGVHVSTVSRALDPKTSHLITSELTERITATARELGYRPNAIAYSLRTKRSRTIGVILPDIMNPIFPPIVRGIEDVLVKAGYAALVVNTDHDIEKEAQHVDMLRARGVDGLIVASVELQDYSFAGLAESLPIVAVNRLGETPGLSAVINDEVAGISAVVDHLAALGHRRIAHIAGPSALSTGAARAAAFRARVAELGLDGDPSLVVEATRFRESEGRRLCEVLLAGTPPTAIVAGNDLLALGAIEGLHARGLSCPGDISVTGYNDMPFVDRLPPPLTTVRIRSYDTGRRAAEIVLQQIETPVADRRPVFEMLSVELIVRASSGPVSGKTGKAGKPATRRRAAADLAASG